MCIFTHKSARLRLGDQWGQSHFLSNIAWSFETDIVFFTPLEELVLNWRWTSQFGTYSMSQFHHWLCKMFFSLNQVWYVTVLNCLWHNNGCSDLRRSFHNKQEKMVTNHADKDTLIETHAWGIEIAAVKWCFLAGCIRWKTSGRSLEGGAPSAKIRLANFCLLVQISHTPP